MRWRGRRESDNVDGLLGGGGAGGGRLKLGGGVGIIVVVVGLYLGVDPSTLMGLVGGGASGSGSAPAQAPPGDDEQAAFVRVILADTEQTWTALFAAAGKRYEMPRLALFTGRVQTACGFQSAAVGPFYCPGDNKAYLDLEFFGDLDRRLGAPGDFARAYVVAHEVGHHIQNLLGTSGDVHRRRQKLSKATLVRKVTAVLNLPRRKSAPHYRDLRPQRVGELPVARYAVETEEGICAILKKVMAEKSITGPVSHYGAIRGTNIFKDVDVLALIGEPVPHVG